MCNCINNRGYDSSKNIFKNILIIEKFLIYIYVFVYIAITVIHYIYVKVDSLIQL